MPGNYDATGYATKYNIRCDDGVTLLPGAFANADGQRVPLVFGHNHTSPDAVLGYADLEAVPDGVIAHMNFSDTPNAIAAKAHVESGALSHLSIYANQLVKNGSDILSGKIREVSLVLSGANSGAKIIYPQLAHGLIAFPEDANEAQIELCSFDGMSLNEGGRIMHESYDDVYDDETETNPLEALLDKASPEEREALYHLVGSAALAGSEIDDEDEDEADEYQDGEDDMQHGMGMNVWDYGGGITTAPNPFAPQYLSDQAKQEIMADAINQNSFREAAIQHGITGIDLMFPEAHNYDKRPQWLDNEDSWVEALLGSVSTAPYFRLRTTVADITADEARALGYITGNRKKDEVFRILKRTVTAQTIVKRQKLDRDTILEVTDFDLIPWLMQEMRVKLRQELARAILTGDGRDSESEDKIREEHIHPIITDDDLFTIKTTVGVSANDSDDTVAKQIIRSAVLGRVKYRGRGTPTMFIGPSTYTHLLLLEDSIGRRIYRTETELNTAMRVSKAVECPLLETTKVNNRLVAAIILNPSDYIIGTAKGGEITKFEDFDINFNQYIYLLETRSSGMLRAPYSAIVLLYPENVTPSWYDANFGSYIATDATAAMTEGGNVDVKYFKASPVAKDDPWANGWYERSGEGTDLSPYVYTESTDRAVNSQKNYYVRSVTVPNRN